MNDQQDRSAFSEMAAALNDHQVTDQTGEVPESTGFEETATQETNTEEETATAEKSEEVSTEAPKATEDTTETGDEPQLAEDESGKRYVPEGRFKKVYGELKAKEREIESLKNQSRVSQPIQQPTEPQNPDKSSQLETELLYVTLPQFNPSSDEYNQELDDLAVQVYLANPGITKLEAARKAIVKAKNLTKDQVKIIAEARSVKSQQSDQGITSRVANRTSDEDKVPGSNASLEEMEAYLKKTGQW